MTLWIWAMFWAALAIRVLNPTTIAPEKAASLASDSETSPTSSPIISIFAFSLGRFLMISESASSDPETSAFKISLMTGRPSSASAGWPAFFLTNAVFGSSLIKSMSPAANSSPVCGKFSKPVMRTGLEGANSFARFPKKSSSALTLPKALSVAMPCPSLRTPFFTIAETRMPRRLSIFASSTKPPGRALGS